MDWIEQLFGLDPDLGSGATEVLLLGAIVIVIAGIALRVRASGRDEQVR